METKLLSKKALQLKENICKANNYDDEQFVLMLGVAGAGFYLIGKQYSERVKDAESKGKVIGESQAGMFGWAVGSAIVAAVSKLGESIPGLTEADIFTVKLNWAVKPGAASKQEIINAAAWLAEQGSGGPLKIVHPQEMTTLIVTGTAFAVEVLDPDPVDNTLNVSLN